MVEEPEFCLFGDRDERLKKALKTFGKTPSDLEQDIGILTEWMKSQPHLPEIPGRAFLSNIVLSNKCSIEKSKKHLDMYYSLRPVLPEIFSDRNFRRLHMITAAKTFCYVPCPKLTEEGYRVSISKLTTSDADQYNLYHSVGYLQNFAEIRMITDVMMGEIFIYDMENVTFAHLSKVTPIYLKKVIISAEKVYKNLMKQMHFIHVSPAIEHLVGIVKQLVKKKLSERIYAHQTIEGVYKHFPKDILPKEYGGSQYSIPELKAKWESLLPKYENRLTELENLKIDESKRPIPLVNDELLGFYGNFKKLNVD